MHPQDKFYFYNSSIGDLTRLMRKYAAPTLTPTPGLITNAYGVRINPKYFPNLLKGREGVEPIPIPANWHADIAEFGAAFRAIEIAADQFTVVELGCGWGCWLNITGVVAKRLGKRVKLIGVEGDIGHIEFAHESLTLNGFSADEFSVHHGVASGRSGIALFPKQEVPGEAWGLEPLFNVPEDRADELIRSGGYQRLRQIPLSDILPADTDRIDLLHIDIQGGEVPLITESITFLRERVVSMLIGTHSRQIEGELFSLLLNSDWVLEVERPAVIAIGQSITTLVDGVQFWRNARLAPSDKVDVVEPNGSVEVVDIPQTICRGETLRPKVRVTNNSAHDWYSDVDHPVRLCYHWIKNTGNYLVYDGIRTSFADQVVQSKSTIEQIMEVNAPNEAGILKLELTIVQDGVRWFEQPLFSPAIVQLTVT